MLNDETLEEQLHRDLERVQPGFVPVEAMISHGRAIRARRRAGVAAGLAAVAALAVGVPEVLGGGGGSSEVSAAGHPAVLASGTIDGKQWSFVRGGSAPPGCADYVASSWGNTSSASCLGDMPAATDPVFLTSSGGEGAVTMAIGQLRPDVDHVRVTGTDGSVLTPSVARITGRRYVFFALPPKVGVARLDAYASNGKAIAYTLPYNASGGALMLVESWYPAGTTPTQAALKRIIFSDTTSFSTPVTVTVDMGPFGVCLLVSAPLDQTGGISLVPDCSPVTPPAPTQLLMTGYPIGERDLVLAEVNNAVAYVDTTLSDGTTTRVTPIRVGGHSFVVNFAPAGDRNSRTRAYDASGALLAQTP